MPRTVTARGHGLGWRRSLPHQDRLRYGAPARDVVLPSFVDLRTTGFVPPVYDQGGLGSCSANSLCFGIQFERKRQGLIGADRVPSRLMLYYLEREIENSVASDAGAELYDGVTAASTTGVCFEDGPNGWPYDTTQFAQRPPPACYAAAAMDVVTQSLAVAQDLTQIRGCLAEGFPVCFGFTCYPDIDSDVVTSTGMLPMPTPGEQPEGGHAVAAVGYDDASRLFLVRNSWGSNWGLGGYFWMPFEYLIRSDLSADFETIRLVA